MIYFLFVSLALAGLVWWILKLPVFGALPAGRRLERIRAQPNYRKGALDNLLPTPMQPEGVSMFTILRAFLKGDPRRRPPGPIIPAAPQWSSGNSDELRLTWFGHSSYLIQSENHCLLVDPVFSERTSPFSFIGTRRFDGMDFIDTTRLPEPDVVLLTHDHYDHLDYEVIKQLRSSKAHFVCSLGVGAHLEHWGIDPGRIHELAWDETISLSGFSLRAVPARHFTGRLFKRNQTAWSAFVLDTVCNRLFLGGDSGYGPHFKDIGRAYGPFDLALLECGQYNAFWPYIHMFPEETVAAAEDLNAAALMPVHWAKFTLAMHAWDDPIRRVSAEARQKGMSLFTPRPGQTFTLAEAPATAWWQKVGSDMENLAPGT
ncbi:MBL fold metallo-hydrolase [Pedobacter yulinensis]|uniref:MBL fold metallo-hydrolase n=1 Tax=Pedobacter yulinensis TaxID=2126353 RepID=A0A2T3HKH0_9SPHI|nr:MBL fold metallo-hydrolase [Pedobacter yulinensis]PST82926.1 MBL fold metallo-hydrolase [Pedobacter yulinensis]